MRYFLTFYSLAGHIVMISPPGSNSNNPDKSPVKSICEKAGPSTDTVTNIYAGESVLVTFKGSASHGGGGIYTFL